MRNIYWTLSKKKSPKNKNLYLHPFFNTRLPALTVQNHSFTAGFRKKKEFQEHEREGKIENSSDDVGESKKRVGKGIDRYI